MQNNSGQSCPDSRLKDEMITATEQETASHGLSQAQSAPNTTEKAVEKSSTETVTVMELPRINVSEKPVHSISSEILEKHLVDPSLNIFQRENNLVQILWDTNDRPYIHEIGIDQMRGILDRCVEFQKTTRSGVDYIFPPLNIVKDILSIGQYPDSIPKLQGITESPIFRTDGTIVTQPGFDSVSQFYYAPDSNGLSIQVSDNPSRRDIDKAVGTLTEILTDFPFVDESSFCNTLALLLTSIVRPAIDGLVPLAIIESTQKGTGKGLLTSVVHYIATGRYPQTLTMPTAEGEIRKQLTSLFQGGSAITVYDNIASRIDSPAFASALTTTMWSDRKLGQTLMKTFANKTTWIANGNNIRLGGDISRRCYLIQLDPMSSRPWQRTDFRFPNLLQHIKEHRSELLSAILTLSRAWFIAGQPQAQVKTMGSFEEWTRVIGGILNYAGVEGFIDNLNVLFDDSDDESTQFEFFFQAWFEHFGNRAVTAKEVCQSRLVELIPDSVIGDGRSGSLAQRVGQMCSKYSGTRFGDEQYHVVKNSTKFNTIVWQVKKASADNIC